MVLTQDCVAFHKLVRGMRNLNRPFRPAACGERRLQYWSWTSSYGVFAGRSLILLAPAWQWMVGAPVCNLNHCAGCCATNLVARGWRNTCHIRAIHLGVRTTEMLQGSLAALRPQQWLHQHLPRPLCKYTSAYLIGSILVNLFVYLGPQRSLVAGM